MSHLIETIKFNFDLDKRLALVGTIQFASSIHAVGKLLKELGYKILIPQCKPLSPGEILGCTAPTLVDDTDTLIYVGDGRFHLESIMIANETCDAYKYDPYNKMFTREYYDFELMKTNRKRQIDTSAAAETTSSGQSYGLILSTLGRQGSPKIMENLMAKLDELNKTYTLIFMSEIFPDKLKLFKGQIDT